MALNVDKNRQLAEYTSAPTAQPKAAQPAASSQPIDFSNKSNNYTVKKGDNLWNVAKNSLIAAGKTSPTNTEIIQAMNKIAAANGCSTPDECRIKCFSRIGTELIIPVLVETMVTTSIDEETTAEQEIPVLTEQETKIKEELKTRFPDLGLQNMTDKEVKAFLDKLKETNPELLSALETAVSASAVDETVPTEGVEDSQVSVTGLTEEQTKTLQEQLSQYITENPEVVTEHSTTPHSTVAKSEIEILAQKVGGDGNIDDIIRELRRKQLQGDDLSADETKLLELYDKNIKAETENSVSGEKKQKLSKEDLIVDYSELLSEKFMNLSPEERLAYFTDKYLSKNDPNYSNLTPQQQKEYVSKTLNEVMKNINNGQIPKTKEEQVQVGIKAVAFMQTAHANHLSLEELAKSPQRDDMVEQTVNNVINDVINIVDKEELKGKTNNIEIAHVYMSKILSLTDPEYNKITNMDDKKDYELKKIAEMVSKYTGTDIDLNSTEGRKKLEAGIDESLSVFKYVMENSEGDNKISMTKLLNGEIPKLKFEQGYNEWLNAQPDSTSKTANLARSEARMSVYKRLHDKGIDKPSNAQFLEELEIMRKEQGGKFEDKCLEEIYTELTRRATDGKLEEATLSDSANMKAASAAGQELDLYFNSKFENLKTKQEKLDVLGELIAGCNGDPDEIIKLREAALKAGFTEEEFKNNLATYGGDNGKLLENAYYKAMNGEQFNCIKHLDNDKERIGSKVEISQQWFQDDIANLTVIDADVLQNTPEYVDRMTIGMHKYGTEESNTALWESIAQSGKVAEANLAQGVDNFMKNAPSDEVRLSYSESLSNIDNAAVLEGVAAGSKYVSNPEVKQQYNSTVTTAAKKYPPETQSNINYAMETGNVSPSTKAKTTPPVSSSSTSSSSSYSSSSYTYGQYTNTASSSSSASTKTNTTTAATSSSSASYTTAAVSSANTVRTNQLESKKLDAMDNAKSTAESIQAAVKDWEEKHSKKLSVEDIDAVKAAAAVEAAREAVESAATSESEKERILKALSNATSISEVYDILVEALGASRVQDKFIEKLAMSGSTANIKAFVTSRAGDNDSIVKQIFLRTSSSSLRKELLGMMSSDTIAELLANKQITDLSAVDQKILISYVMKNIFLMSNNEFVRFLNAIADPNEKEKLIALRTKNGKKQQDTAPEEVPPVVNTATTSDAPTVTLAPQAFASANLTESAPEKEEPLVQPTTTSQSGLGVNEFSRDMGDGTILTREGAGFGAISDTDFDLAHVVKKPKHEDGAPIGMEDDTLTVGSAEWNKKYNRNNVQSTAFTRAALDESEDDEFGGTWFGNKGNFKGKGIKKKPFRFNA